MNILIGCEVSGIVREAFRRLGHNAWSCDLLPADDGSRYHLQGDLLEQLDSDWDMLIAHPECTYLTCSAEWAYGPGPYHQKVKPETLTGQARLTARDQAADFFMTLANAPINHICIENPVGVMSSRWRKADQYIQPYQFGDDASKRTGLWLKNLSPLVIKPEDRYPGRWVEKTPARWNGEWGVERWSNQSDSGQNRLGPSADRAKVRSETYPGIAHAMAANWGY